MTKGDLIDAVQKDVAKMELSKAAVNAVFDSIFAQLKKAIKKDRRFSVPDFGTFSIKERKARMGRNPQTGAAIKIPKSKTVGFKAAPKLKKGL
jgi:DNA-binding protein HU-beta